MSQTIIIIGAGAAGLFAAKELAEKGNSVVILEAATRVGGRIHTLYNSAFDQPVEEGAEFIHGKLPITFQLLKEAGIRSRPVKGRMIRVNNREWLEQEDFAVGWNDLMQSLHELKEDMTLAAFLQEKFNGPQYARLRQSVIRFAEGFDLADPHKASLFALRDEWIHEEDGHYRIPGGFQQLVHYLQQQCKKAGCVIHTSCIVKKIFWKKNEVRVTNADGNIFVGNKVIVTVPLGVLLAGHSEPAAISFEPAIPEYIHAASQIGYGSVIKILLQFREAFWTERGPDIGFLLIEEIIPTWWTQYPDPFPLLTGWLGGPPAISLSEDDESVLRVHAINSVSAIFNIPVEELQHLITACHISNWQLHPFSKGGYSYSTLESAAARIILNEPIDDTLFFAGEALYNGPSPGTVEAALVSGKDVSGKI